jgi:hypothetical protein
MEPSGSDEKIMLSLYCGDDKSDSATTCPAVHRVHRTDRRSWLWQGELRNDPDVRSQLHKPSPTEVGVEVGDDLVDTFVRAYVKERYGVDLG